MKPNEPSGAVQSQARAEFAPDPAAPDFADDEARLRVLAAHDADALEDDPELARIVAFAARLCEAPIVQVSLVERERQRFLAGEGLDVRETARDISFCTHAMTQPGLMEVTDAREDTRFAGTPLVARAPHVRFYAGQPLVSEEGAPLGTLCVIDTEPRPEGLSDFQREGLEVLAQAVMRRLSARREARAAERELMLQQEAQKAMADSMPAIVWSADPDGNFDYFNKGLRDLVGEGGETGEAVHPDDKPHVDAAWAHSLKTGETYETEHRVRFRDGNWRWMLARAIPMRDEDGRILRWFGTAVDIDDVHNLSESRDLLSKELAHRIKNIFAVVTGLVSLQARKYPEHSDFADGLVQTLRALGRAHDFVRPAHGDTNESLTGLLDVLFAPYGTGDDARVRISGDEASIAPRAATPLALVFHELATNSAKYGALSSDEGEITLDVADEGDTISLVWREQGGPPPTSEQGEGFGSRLVEMSVSGQLGGSWERRFEDEGLVVELTVSKEAVAS